MAYDLATGKEKWKWAGDGTAYASPILDTVDGGKEIVAETSSNIVGIGVRMVSCCGRLRSKCATTPVRQSWTARRSFIPARAAGRRP